MTVPVIVAGLLPLFWGAGAGSEVMQRIAAPMVGGMLSATLLSTLGSSAAEIAQLMGWSTAKVHVMHSRWAKEGEAIFDVRARGGRHHQYLTPEQEQEQEQELLAPFVQRARAGGMLTVSEVQQAYREHSGKDVARSTIYRLLERHGWRKVVPRPRHPKADQAAQSAFKKTAPHGTPRGLSPG